MQIKRISSIGHFREVGDVTVHISEATALVERPLADGDDRVGDGDAPRPLIPMNASSPMRLTEV